MRIVLDTNIFLISISRRSSSNWLFQDIINGRIELCVTNEILTEYEEALTMHWNETVAQDTIRTLLKAKSVFTFDVFFRFNLISFDEDDNKFVDCAVASNADYLVTNDSHFAILKHISFPRISVINLAAFEKTYRNQR